MLEDNHFLGQKGKKGNRSIILHIRLQVSEAFLSKGVAQACLNDVGKFPELSELLTTYMIEGKTGGETGEGGMEWGLEGML